MACFVGAECHFDQVGPVKACVKTVPDPDNGLDRFKPALIRAISQANSSREN